MARADAFPMFPQMFSRRARRRALIVDDDETTQAILSSVLEAADFQCDCVSNSAEALAALAGRHHNLVLLDVGLPDIDGFRVLKALRAGHSATGVSIVDACADAHLVIGSRRWFLFVNKGGPGVYAP